MKLSRLLENFIGANYDRNLCVMKKCKAKIKLVKEK